MPQPIKRSKSLVSLSKEHHDGLLLCWKVRTGCRNKTELTRIANYIVQCYQTNLKQHFEHEETLLFSLLPDTDEMKIKALEQHQILAGIVEKLDRNNDCTESTLLSFADELDDHIRFEERQLFNYIETIVEPAQLEKAGNILNKLHLQHCETEWQDEFWNYKK